MYKLSTKEQQVLQQAQAILLKVMERSPMYSCELQANAPEEVVSYLQAKLGSEDREHLVVLFLDNQNRLITTETLFSGTVNQSAVYPREIVRQALELNSAAVIISHNHPSGEIEPSQADKLITNKIKDACNMLDIRLVDHIIVSATAHYSFSENCLL